MRAFEVAVLTGIGSAISWGCFDTEIVHYDGASGAAGVREPGVGGRPGVPRDCLRCAESACAEELAACESSAGCEDVAACMLACTADDVVCTNDCVVPDVRAVTGATRLTTCAYRKCEACIAGFLGEGGTAGAADNGGQGGSSAGRAAGGSATGGSAGRGGSSQAVDGGTGGGSSQAGSGGATLHAGVNWLALDGSRADESMPPNGALRIHGSLYAYGDGCATLSWDAERRCVSGTLCPIDAPLYENWGVAVGFDFRDTGTTGSPPNTKFPWNPDEVGAKGIAWQISGTAPALQVWILNMDPMWGGACSEAACEIAGPPDGASSPPLAGQLSFDNLQKDDWGGAGTRYVFDRSAVHAVQFKLPGIIAGGMAFDFCVDRIGIVL